MERINANHSGPERKAALVGLLEQETYLIQSIERHRINADQINEEEFIMKTLEKVKLFIDQYLQISILKSTDQKLHAV